MKTLLDYYQACGPLAVEVDASSNPALRGLTNDSREVQRGHLFVAINGAVADGRQYIDKAIEQGAAAIVYQDRAHRALPVPSIRVSHDYQALGRLAEFHFDFPAARLKLIGVTGTNGKTTTTFLLRHILDHCGLRPGMLSTVQYDLGQRVQPADRTTPTPLELQSLLAEMAAAGRETAVMEASSHSLAQGRMGSARYDAAVFTNLTRDHLDYHRTMARYYAAKKLLFTKLLQPQGAAIVNLDDRYGRRLVRELRGAGDKQVITYGFAKTADVRVLDCVHTASGAEVILSLPERTMELHSPMAGNYNVSNLLAALATALHMGVEAEQAVAAVESFTDVPGRLQRISGRAAADIDVFIDYAHTDDALSNVLKTVRSVCRGRLVVVFGCGGDRDRGKRTLMGKCAAELADDIVVTSDNPRSEDPEQIIQDILGGIPGNTHFASFTDRRQAIMSAIRQAHPRDAVVIAGKGHEDYQEIAGKKFPFSDFEVGVEAVDARIDALAS